MIAMAPANIHSTRMLGPPSGNSPLSNTNLTRTGLITPNPAVAITSRTTSTTWNL